MGQTIHPGFQVALWHSSTDVFMPLKEEHRFRVVLVEEGTGILRLGGRRIPFIAPVLFCLNEQEEPKLENGANLRARAYFFHPNVINSAFELERVRSDGGDFSTTEWYDLSWLRPFLERNEKYTGQLGLGPASLKRMGNIFDTLQQELSLQKDDYWPCRSRSFFLELLFLIERIYTSPAMSEEMILPDTPGEMDAVILYLHTHYQERVTLPELTKVFHLNRTTLTQRFFEATGVSVVSYLINLRVRLAALILRDTTVPISEVMERVGFKDMTHFGRMFRRLMGETPSEYRKKYCWML